MSDITIYGVSSSRAMRSLWAIEEVGVEYRHVPTHFFEDSKTPEYLAINPNGRIPTLVDGDLVLFESMAINLYLAEQYGGALYPKAVADRAHALQWSVWGISEIEPLQMRIVVQKFFTPAKKQIAGEIAAPHRRGSSGRFSVLDDALAERPYLLGDAFTVADLNVAAVMLILNMVQHDFSAFANVRRWADACFARAALTRAQALD